MKNMKKFASILLALVMVLAMTAYAAGTGSITITPPEGVDGNASHTYTIYKVFDADGNGTSISYKLVEGKETAPEGFSVDTAGNVTYTGTGTGGQLTADDIAAIAEYVKDDQPVATATSTGSAAAVASNLPNGYYYITTSTGSVVTINSTNPNAEVNDKNTVPTVDKDITEVDVGSIDEDGKKALAQVGTEVEFTATIIVGNGAVNYVFHDTMSRGLAYNNDVTVTGINADQYTVKETPDTGDTITIEFVDGIAAGTEITIKYSATITESALTTDPENNTAYISYGDENSHNKTPVTENKVYNAQLTVTKTKKDDTALEGAGFVIKNSAGAYYKYDATSKTVSWHTLAEDETLEAAIKEGKVTEYTSDADGKVAPFIGLANGSYTLVESTVPAGFNKAADSTFTIAEHNYTTDNLEQAKTVVNEAGATLPTTGGMGTTLIYAVGALLVAGAVIVMISKKRAAAK